MHHGSTIRIAGCISHLFERERESGVVKISLSGHFSLQFIHQSRDVCATVGGISTCVELAQPMQLGLRTVAVFSLADLLNKQTQKESCQRDPLHFNPLNLTNLLYDQYYYCCFCHNISFDPVC